MTRLALRGFTLWAHFHPPDTLLLLDLQALQVALADGVNQTLMLKVLLEATAEGTVEATTRARHDHHTARAATADHLPEPMGLPQASMDTSKSNEVSTQKPPRTPPQRWSGA